MKYCRKKLHLVNYKVHIQCPECLKACRRIRYFENIVIVTEQKRQDYVKHRTKRLATNTKAYKIRYKDPIQRKKINIVTSLYKKLNPAKHTALEMKRRALKLQRSPKWLTSLHFNQIQMFYDAAAKLSKEFGIKMSVDHILPLQGKIVSGLHVPWNLQVISIKENCSKNNSFRG